MKKRSQKRQIIIITLFFFFIPLFKLIKVSTGVLTYLILSTIVILAILTVRAFHSLIGTLFNYDLKLRFYFNILLSVCSVMIILTLFELYLHINHQQTPTNNQESLTMPEEWKKRPVKIEGARSAHYYHGKLHVFNEVGMRRTTPFPPKRKDYYRIMVVGDSLTYGQGVDAKDTYTSIMETELSKYYRVEVLNLGIAGFQSEDILKVVLFYTPQLQPDIIIYGVCLNDFLESGELQRSRAKRQTWAFPLPSGFKNFMIQHTLSGEFFEKSYDDLLMRLGIRADFFNNILRDLYDYQIRFTRDVTVMNYFAVHNELPPIMAMVLDQNPKINGRGHKVACLAERILTLVGMDVISTEEYYKKYDGRRMGISRWDGHPNEEAHKIFAEYFIRALKAHPVLQQYRM